MSDDTAELLSALAEAMRPVKVGRGNYTQIDRFRDFSRVFLGTDEGKRVLAQIIDLCEGRPVRDDELSNHALLAARAKARNVGQQIAAWASIPPSVDAGQKST